MMNFIISVQFGRVQKGRINMVERIDRLQETIKRTLSFIIVQEISDPRVRDIIISRVELTGDLMVAKVFCRVTENSANDAEEILKGLKSARGFIRRELAKTISMKFIPQISFKRDMDEEKRNALEDIFERIKNEKS